MEAHIAPLHPLFPKQPVPNLDVPTVGGEIWTLTDQKPEHLTMLVFYLGFHCLVCANYLKDLARKLEQFDARSEVLKTDVVGV